MSLNLHQSGVSLSDPQFGTMLDNLQANILKGHGRHFSYHLFFEFDPAKTDQAKQWIADFKVTTAMQQLKQTAERDITGKDGGTIFTLSLSAKGYDVLGKTSDKPTSSASFLGGMKADKDALGDEPENWIAGFTRDVHLFILVADSNPRTADSEAQKIITQVTAFANLSLSQQGKVLKKEDAVGGGIEHFGYADGISQPLYLADEIAKQAGNKEWKDETNLDLLLVKDGPADDDHYGSYFVFRKLEQNVKGFKSAEGDHLPQVQTKTPSVIDEKGDHNQDLAGAMLVGRYENGSPVIKSSLEIPKATAVVNDFDYHEDTVEPASKCPFHSHIRLMNPRNGDPQAGDLREHRITRRGMPFDDAGRFGRDVIDITDDMLEKEPEGGVGLLFMCYQANIDNQFKILQAFWANKGNVGGHLIEGQDSIIGQGTNPDKKLPLQWGKQAESTAFNFPKMVRNNGGEYFFTPSVGYLAGIVSA